MTDRDPGINGRLVHARHHPDATGAVKVPAYQTSR